MSRWRPYRMVLWAFPAELRARHGNDMAQLFADRCHEARAGVSPWRGRLRLIGLWLMALRDALVHGVLARFGAGRVEHPLNGESRGSGRAGTGSPMAAGSREPSGGALHADGRRSSGPRGRGGWRQRSREPLAATLLHDLRYAARGLRDTPVFTAVALLTLALGIGASTAIFTLVNALMLRSLPVHEPDRLVHVTMDTSAMGFDATRITNPLWEALRDRETMFEGAFATSDVYFDVESEGEGERERLRGAWVSGGYFDTLGLTPAAGRLIGRADDQRGCPAIAVLGHGYWQRRFAGADVVGRTLTLNDQRFEIVGVVQAGYRGMFVEAVTEVYAPLCAEAIVRGDYSSLDAPRNWWIDAVGRLPEGVEPAAIRAELRAMTPALLAEAVPTDGDETRQAEFLSGAITAESAATGFSGVRNRYRESLFVLLGAVGVVMLVVCGNLANLLLARAARRRKEIAMRVALGATRRRLLGQFLTESLLLAGLGALLGMVLAHWGSRTLVALISPSDGVLPIDVGVDLRVLTFTSAVAALTGVLFGLAPALQAARVDPHAAMRAGTGAVGGVRLLAGGALVALQVTLSLVLLTGAALLVGTLVHLETLDPGFDRAHVLLLDAELGADELDAEQRRPLVLGLLEQLRALPGVRAASFTEVTPISGNSMTDFVVAAGYRSLLDEDVEVHLHRVGDGYFASLGAPLLRGRDIAATDVAGSERVAVISESMARQLFGGLDAVGRIFHQRLNDSEVGEPIRVVGVVGDAKYRTLRDENVPTAYFALRQQPWFGRYAPTYQLLAQGEVAPLSALIRATVEAAGGAGVETKLLSAQLSASLARERLMASISGFFGGLALFLAVIGLYGVMSFHVTRRFPEIGVRLALGSSAGGVFGLVLRQAARPVVVGLVLGVLASLAATRTLTALLYGFEPHDARVLIFSALALALAALGSAALPARRAARLDPAVVMRRDAT